MMRIRLQNSFLSTIFFLLLLELFNSENSFHEVVKAEEDIVGRYQFPDGFLFGAATSSYQIEGAILEDGKGLSNWDAFVHINGNIPNGDTGDIADDHYHRYLEDIEIMHSLGINSYRFSISWSRILPKGKFGDINPDGIAFYNRLIDDMLLKGIQPFVTIHHNDIPKELDDKYGGWLSSRMQDDFVHFAETCFKNFGDRVKYWVTINEPNLVSEMGYMRGMYSPGRCSPPFGNCSAGNSDIEPLIAMHNMLLGHSKAAKLYRDRFKSKQNGIIGVVIHAFMFEPLTDGEHDRNATNRAFAFNIGWFSSQALKDAPYRFLRTFDPLVFGNYPPEMRSYLGSELPMFTVEETKLIKNSIDFIGMNHYSTLYVKDCIYASCNCLNDPGCLPGGERAIKGFLQIFPKRDGIFIGEPTGIPAFFVVPRGMEGIVDYVKNRYHNKPIFITENGYSSPIQSEQSNLQHDVKRIDYHKSYLASLARAMRNGADVRGYFIWSLMDNFEWSTGYRTKFGLYSIDPVTLNRAPRLSATWYSDFMRNNNSPNGTQQGAAMLLKKEDEFMPSVKDERAEM